jgi:putative ATPase
VRLRPTTLDEFVGQDHLLGPGSALRTAIEEGRPHSMVLYGPPGSGKTTLARIIAGGASAAFEEVSAVEAGRAEVRAVLERAAHRRHASGEPTIFFLDEIHRFNKAQQDALLPAVEEGLVTLIGATTENPYFEVNSALLSRAQVYELQALTAAETEVLLRRAIDRGECGAADVADEVVEFLAARAGGDARTALAGLELACETAAATASDGDATVTLEQAEDALQRRAVLFDKAGDQHYDYISAWIKATRGSDPDASLYYLAVMIEGGEDPRFIARRMVVLASEDIGNADPAALSLASAAAHAVEHVGMPECQFALAQAAIYLSLAPKSDAVKRAVGAARTFVRDHGAATPPDALRSAAYPGAKALGRGEGYDYPHARPGHVSPQELLPAEVEGARFYTPDDAEPELARRLEEIRRARGRDA